MNIHGGEADECPCVFCRAQPVSSMTGAPKDRRILGYAEGPFDCTPAWLTMRWCNVYECWECDPNEATEYDHARLSPTAWLPLPPDPS